MTPAWRGLLRSAALNAAGQGLPLLAAVVAVPMLVAALGPERVGLLTIGWAVIGYFSLFDLGLGRALTQAVSARHEADEIETGALIRRALGLMLGLGVAGGALLAVASPWLVSSALRISPELRQEALDTFLLLAASVPAVVLTSGLRGVLEARQRFDLVNAIRAPLGIFTFAAPLAVLPFTDHLGWVIALLLVGRLLALAAHIVACVRVAPFLLTRSADVVLPALGPLLRNGGWMTVSNIVSPLMSTADRFVIAAIASAAVVAYYTVPFEVATKLLILSHSIASPLFASFAALREPEERSALMTHGMLLTCAVVFPATLALILAAPEGMRAWMGVEFARHAAPVLQLLGIGVFINSVAQAPFALLQATGRSKITATLHLLELPLYLATVVALVRHAGIQGAALAWVLRAVVDCLLLSFFALRAERVVLAGRRLWVWGGAALATIVTAGAALVPMDAPVVRVGYGSVSLVALGGALLLIGRARRTSAPAR